jgi:hypothetical protein
MGRRPSVIRDGDKPEGRSVCLCAGITLSNLTGEGRRDLIADIVAIDPSSKARPVGDGPVPRLPLGGRILGVTSPDDQSTIITLAAWNTGESQSISRSRANPSHAERQFIDFMERKQRSDGDFFAHITKLDVSLDRSPCAPCSDALVGLLRDIRRAQPTPAPTVVIRREGAIVSRTEAGKSTLGATLSWGQLYESGVHGTTWQNLLELSNVGWRLMAPRDARPLDSTYHTDLVHIDDA